MLSHGWASSVGGRFSSNAAGLSDGAKRNVTETVKAWREYAPHYIPLPHPSWRNNAWLQKNPWFAEELLPYLRKRVAATIGPPKRAGR